MFERISLHVSDITRVPELKAHQREFVLGGVSYPDGPLGVCWNGEPLFEFSDHLGIVPQLLPPGAAATVKKLTCLIVTSYAIEGYLEYCRMAEHDPPLNPSVGRYAVDLPAVIGTILRSQPQWAAVSFVDDERRMVVEPASIATVVEKVGCELRRRSDALGFAHWGEQHLGQHP